MTKAKYRIKQNVWGNWNGYLGNKKVAEIGSSEFDAKAWLKEKQANPSADSTCDFACQSVAHIVIKLR